MFLIRRKVFKGIGATVGLATESRSAKKAKKTEGQQRDEDNHDDQTKTVHVHGVELHDNDSVYSRDIDHDHEEHWELDEAQDQLVEQRTPGWEESTDEGHLAEAFAAQYPLPLFADRKSSLPYPIVLPQRRPGARARGFVRAYPPDLNAFGIDKDMFLDFVDTANHACKGPKALGLLNLAPLALIPFGMGLIGFAVGVAMQIATTTAITMEGRRRSNNFFDVANRDIFMPRGLFCLVMTWNPDIDDPHVIYGLDEAIDKAMPKAGGGFEKLKHKYAKSSGESHANQFFAEIAPLEFPDLDRLGDAKTKEKHKTFKEHTQAKYERVSAYKDKREQAKFNADHPDSALTHGPKPEFSSRYADPKHPANEGSPIALLTGGHLTEKQILKYTPTGFLANQGYKAYKKHQEAKTQAASTGDAVYEDSSSGDPKKMVYNDRIHTALKGLKSKVVYLMIVNLPSNEELRQVRQELGFE
ncbi:hypothetical protein ASPWEDRAFT_177402 [Aspergillus wentii DTO 134E9]|uniref:Uncharacterized protein n=1 Tax=Aspergillus wentii DTO 134E9 TaxID=1073089 RepID=A0A1L9R406_ASPWE|nr:uncharacterized protein ASPWEDRAFT_177402 [Aspergillus wentii DTO 134E9]OJJ29661.1 hypothetical protein ASPWEDRAFT_177402 [Aspergillus wentii DTO 134E9]